MYRLLNVPSFTKNHLLSIASDKWKTCGCTNSKTIFSTAIDFKISNKLKSNLFDHSGLRFQSTTTNAGIATDSKKKIVRYKRKKVTELLQINNGSYKQTTAPVRNLKSKHLSDFINNVELIPLAMIPIVRKTSSSQSEQQQKQKQKTQFDEYGKYSLMKLQATELQCNESGEEAPILFVGKESLKIDKKSNEPLQNIIDSYKFFKELHSISVDSDFIPAKSIDFISPQVFEEEEAEIGEEIIDEIDPIYMNKKKSTNSVKLKASEKLFQSKEFEIISRHHTLISNLTTYLELCVSGGMVNRGFATLLAYRFKCKRTKNTMKITNIHLYNILLSGYADKANINKIKEILAVMKEDKIQPNAQTYATILECFGRTPDCAANTKQIRKYLTDANSIGITLNNILDKSQFTSDKREIVLDVIAKVDPTFVPNYTPPVLKYNNKLVDSLNEHIKPIDNENSCNTIHDGCEIMNAKRGFSKEQLIAMSEKQLEIEFNTNITIKSIQKFPPIDDQVVNYRKKLTDLQSSWRNQIRFAFCRDLNILKSQTQSKGNRAINLLPYLRVLNVEQYADILVQEIKQLAEGSETFSLTVGQLYKHLGHRVEARYYMDRKQNNGVLDKIKEVYDDYCSIISDGISSDNSRQCWQRIVHAKRFAGASMDIKDRPWPPAVTAGVGRFLYQILMRDVKIDVSILRPSRRNEPSIPAFYTLFRNEGRVVKEEIKPHPVLAKLHRGSQPETLTFPSNTVPMFCPPQPWSTPHNGGYLLARSDLIRLPYQAYQQWERVNATHSEDMYPSLDSLNQLASIPWTVHNGVLDVILEVFNNGGSKELDVPQPPSALPQPNVEFGPALTKPQKYELFRRKLIHRRKQSEMYGLWCEALYRLSLANHYRDKVFWLPHNMDFRGRVYPIPPHLNHLGSDLARALLIFHQKQPLGKNGFQWLKLHCINLTGLKKKCSIQDRLAYADEVMDDILDSAHNPLTGRRWWSKSDEPWQTLAVCMEIANVTRCPDPTKYMSSMPIHQDGSCNGLQHYAALGRDTAGAINVNLAESKLPQDVYSAVAALVEKARAADAEKGLEIAAKLNGYVQRKVIKQTVMTTVYGVTRYGARLQIAKQLKDIDSFPKDDVWRASNYLTAKTFESLREMFTSTKEIQDWFTHCARLISAIGGHNVEWVTPLGLPVVQPYNRMEKTTPKLNQKIASDLHARPNVMKQKNAFPPNFIHSLDSTHMMLTSLHCERAGLTFVSVHDCYWTHACNVATMNRICREQFVALHSQPILEDLSKHLVRSYSYNDADFKNDGSVLDTTKRKLNKVIQTIPAKGDFELNNVLNSIYFFS